MQTKEVAWPRWTIAALAVLGIAVTSYITYTKLTAGQTAFCTQGAGCDLVLQSVYANLFGVPLSVFGLGLYVLIALVTVLPGIDGWRWPALFALALGGVTFTAYLVYLLVFEIAAFCLYCSISAAAITGIFALTLFGHRWEKPDNLVLAGLGIVLVAMGTSYGTFLVQSANAGPVPYSEALAKYLRSNGAKFYGASWCPHCKEQKELFGEEALRFVPYVECSPNGRGAAPAKVCLDAGIEVFPTWDIGGKRYTGTLPLPQLANYAGFKAPADKS